ncbi:FMN-dependent NADH-azoreductase [Dickeya lacustris]|uniref:FMN dependent NADH:quinone oxidoreductase n=1 Tax=Dickeya lacustris TaxID=2259638 RepID=A0ABY8GAU1_9GAMM|nr:FMN-dependent NADH-azoreductase [Dickeya lacustris]WFN57025.1 FMN-dependent NADH-azoreductase [Dickeya lacustris]
MPRVLHIDSSILQGNSVTRLLSAEIINTLKEKYPDIVVNYRDVVREDIAHLTGPIAAGFRSVAHENISEYVAEQHRLSEVLVSEFLSSQIIVIGAPMYNFSIPTQLKSWLDRLAQAGKTFQYTEKGPVGLAGGRTVMVASGRGGFYGSEPLAEMDFQERYLAAYFRFLGIHDVHFIRAEGVSKGEAIRQQSLQMAMNAMTDVIATINV